MSDIPIHGQLRKLEKAITDLERKLATIEAGSREILDAHWRNWNAIADHLSGFLPHACLAGVDVDDNSESVVAAVEELRKKLRLAELEAKRVVNTVVYTIGGACDEGIPTSPINYLQRLRRLVADERGCKALDADAMMWARKADQLRDALIGTSIWFAQQGGYCWCSETRGDCESPQCVFARKAVGMAAEEFRDSGRE